MKLPPIIILLVVTILAYQANSIHAADELDNAIESRLVAQQEARQSQTRTDNLADETKGLLDKYRYAIRRTDSLKAYI